MLSSSRAVAPATVTEVFHGVGSTRNVQQSSSDWDGMDQSYLGRGQKATFFVGRKSRGKRLSGVRRAAGVTPV